MTTELAQAILARDRRALARAITLVESGRTDHRAEAVALLDALAGHPGAKRCGSGCRGRRGWGSPPSSRRSA
jgi:LAO/AO transport system kinase